MSFDKAIRYRKERRQYYDSRKYDPWCRNHGKCHYCRGNRVHSDLVRRVSADEAISEYFLEESESVRAAFMDTATQGDA